MSNPAKTDPLKLVQVEAETLFEVTGSGRLLHENSPDREIAPRLWIGRSRTGSVVRVRNDLDEQIASAIEALARSERPMGGPLTPPAHLEDYFELLAAHAPIRDISRGITYLLPRSITYTHEAHVVSSESRDAAPLLAQIKAEGMPAGLAQMGFNGPADLWPPWSAVLDEGSIASIAFTARLSRAGAEVGVATVPASRGRGFAAAATASWASHPSLNERVLFYSTDSGNASSQRVSERLGLDVIGDTFSIR